MAKIIIYYGICVLPANGTGNGRAVIRSSFSTFVGGISVFKWKHWRGGRARKRIPFIFKKHPINNGLNLNYSMVREENTTSPRKTSTTGSRSVGKTMNNESKKWRTWLEINYVVCYLVVRVSKIARPQSSVLVNEFLPSIHPPHLLCTNMPTSIMRGTWMESWQKPRGVG